MPRLLLHSDSVTFPNRGSIRQFSFETDPLLLRGQEAINLLDFLTVSFVLQVRYCLFGTLIAMPFVLTEYFFERIHLFRTATILLSLDMSLDDVVEHFIGIVSKAAGEGDLEERLLVDICDVIDLQTIWFGPVPRTVVFQSSQTTSHRVTLPPPLSP